MTGVALDFPVHSRQSHTVPMTRRLTTLLLTLLYVSVAVWVGVVHHHEHGTDHPDECAACVWQLHAVADLPITTTSIEVWLVETPLPHSVTASLPAQFVPTSASRAPPVMSA